MNTNYFIRDIHYCNNNPDTFIDEVNTLSKWDGKKSRAEVIQDIENGCVVKTASTYTPGAEVFVVTINGIKYLRTDTSKIANDSIGNLPTYIK